MDPRADICVKCGVRQSGSSGEKSRTTAALFALFLGGIGVHRFYIGDTAKGILYLVFCWTFIPGIIALIEAIRWFSMSDAKFHEDIKNIGK